MIQPIRKIGNSQGILLPRVLLQQAGIGTAVDVEIAEGGLILRPVKKHPRESWDDQFAKAINDKNQPDDDLFAGIENEFDQNEWTW